MPKNKAERSFVCKRRAVVNGVGDMTKSFTVWWKGILRCTTALTTPNKSSPMNPQTSRMEKPSLEVLAREL